MSGQWFFVTVPTIEYEKLLTERLETIENNVTSSPKPPTRKKKHEDAQYKKKHKHEDKNNLIEKEQGCDNEGVSPEEDSLPQVTVEVEDEEFHQVTLRPQGKRRFMKADKNKFKSRVSQIETMPLEEALEKILERLKISSAVWNKTKDFNYWQVCFNVSSGSKSDWVLRVLNSNGISRRPGSSLSILPCSIFYKSPVDEEKEEDFLNEEEKVQKSKWDLKRDQFLKTVRARLTVAQIVDGVTKNAALTFDYLVLIVLASIIAALGLVENSSVILVASMLISPLMGPILAGTFGTVINDWKLRRQGIKNELLGLGICILCGLIFGLIFGAAGDSWGLASWPTEEMISRGRARSLWVGLLIALPSGAGVALSVLGGNAGSLVGVAISASLLPPAVNAGLLWAVCLVKAISGSTTASDDYISSYSDNMAVESAVLGIMSLMLTLINIFCIFVTGVLVLKLKEVTPGSSVTSMQRFWKQDLKIVRELNKSGAAVEKRQLDDFTSFVDGDTSLGAQHEVRSIIENVRDDPTFRDVRAFSMYPTNELLLPQSTWHVDLSGDTQNNINSIFSECSYYSVSSTSQVETENANIEENR